MVPYAQGQPYDYTTMEALPRDPTQHPMFAESERQLKIALAPILRTLDTKCFQDPELSHLYTRLQSFEKYPEQKTSIFAARGPVGAGTSATVSNLLGSTLFSEHGGGSDAITKVPHEFVHCATEGADFQSTVHFRESQNIQIELSERLEAMYRFRNPGEDWVDGKEQLAINTKGGLARKALSYSDLLFLTSTRSKACESLSAEV